MGMIDDLRTKIKEGGKKLRDKQENYDGTWRKLTRPEWFDENNNRTPKHPKYGKPRDPKSSLPIKKMAAGGSASKRADGIAQKGKTKGRMV